MKARQCLPLSLPIRLGEEGLAQGNLQFSDVPLPAPPAVVDIPQL